MNMPRDSLEKRRSGTKFVGKVPHEVVENSHREAQP